jgi:hypothetical protein
MASELGTLTKPLVVGGLRLAIYDGDSRMLNS